MTRFYTWKSLSVVVGVALVAALMCLAFGNSGMTTALIVVAVIELAFGSALIAVRNTKRRTNT